MTRTTPTWRRLRRRNRSSDGEAGQGLVELALLLPVFITLFFGLIEFSLVFSTYLNLNYASRNAALLAAEAGNASGGDCVVLRSIERDVNAPSSANRISTVDIYWANPDGSVRSGNVNSYSRSGSSTCTFADGSTLTVPYSVTASGYPASSRCNVLKGCGNGHLGLDTVGVKVTYSHGWVTPVARAFAGSSATTTVVSASSMRMEPVL